MAGYVVFLDIVARVFLVLGVITGVICLIDWAIRERRINPFSGIARFFRRTIDPLMRPVETKIVRFGGQPASAPLWVFLGVIVSGIMVLQLLRVVGGLLSELSVGLSSPRDFALMLAGWALQFLYIALLVRVFTSWLPISPYSMWVRWSYVSTEWLLAPIRRVIPRFGAFDVSPIGALVLIWLAQGILGKF